MDKSADFRSDTFTMPDEGMRKAIYQAEVGNAGYREDPSVNRLEKAMAEYFQCDDAIFLPSATMANQAAIAVWARPGDIVLIEKYGHSYYFESGAMAAIAGAQACLLDGKRGILDPADIARELAGSAGHGARISLVILENSSNFGGGSIYPESSLHAIFNLATENSLPVHIDGARIWNVISATACDPAGQLQAGGSMSVCFSKGLGAPMGAALLGPASFIDEARRMQTILGGSMRQVGFMAAAALYSFENNRERLAEDHDNARHLADLLHGTAGIEIDMEGVQTNMVYMDVVAGSERASALVEQLDAEGIRALNVGPRIRFVTSMLVNKADCERAAKALNKLLC